MVGIRSYISWQALGESLYVEPEAGRVVSGIEGVSSGWVRFCIGAAILMLSATPLLHVVRWW